jgi:hypothetical protein
MFDTNHNLVLNSFCKLDFVTRFDGRMRDMARSPSRLRSVCNKLKDHSLKNTPACYLSPECSTSWAFFMSACREQVRRYTWASYNRETLYTDECFMNHGTAALCKRLLETGKWLTLAVGSRYERLIIELHRLADNSTGRYGYNLRLTRG